MKAPSLIAEVTSDFQSCLSFPTYNRLLELFVARLLAVGPSTLTNLSRIVGMNPYSSAFHGLLSRYSICLWSLSFFLTRMILALPGVKGGRVKLAVDDTTCLHKGKSVFGRAKHRDGSRSSQGFLIPLMGHKWVVVSIVLKFPFSGRDWALPVAVALCHSKEENLRRKKRHKTTAHIARLLIAKIARSFPEFSFIVLGDKAYGSYDCAKFWKQAHVPLVSKFSLDAALYKPVSEGEMSRGRPRIRGKRLPSPGNVVENSLIKTVTEVSWYGGKTRKVEIVEGQGNWYRQGKGTVEVKWVHVKDLTGTHRDEILFTTDLNLSAGEIVSLYTSRWSIEITFEECKGLLRVEKTRVWSQKSVERLPPFIFCSYSLCLLAYLKVPEEKRSVIWWQGKSSTSFSDIVRTLRRLIWIENLLSTHTYRPYCLTIQRKFQELLLNGLCQAA